MARIEAEDAVLALQKWYGVGATEDHRYRWSDGAFFTEFGHLRAAAGTRQLPGPLLRAFAAPNKDNDARRRTGGYSIARRFLGGVEQAAQAIHTALRSQGGFDPSPLPRPEQVARVVALVQAVGGIELESARGTKRILGISAATKLLFFLRPDLPVFIYDKYAAKALRITGLRPGDYADDWHRPCAALLAANAGVPIALPQPHEQVQHGGAAGGRAEAPTPPSEDWMRRRCLDLMLFRIGNSGGRVPI